MSLFPPLPFQVDQPILGAPVVTAPYVRSHLVERAPTGEPVERIRQTETLERQIQILAARVIQLEARCDRLEQYLEDRTWRARLRRWRAAVAEWFEFPWR
jgi:hypothetical protein